MSDLDQRRQGVRSRARQAVREALWQAHGQPLDGVEELERDAVLAVDTALEVFAAQAELWADCAEQLAAAVAANEACRDEVLAMRGQRRPTPP